VFEDCLYRWHVNNLNHTCTYNSLTEDEPSGLKDVEFMVKIILVFKKSAFCWFIVYDPF